MSATGASELVSSTGKRRGWRLALMAFVAAALVAIAWSWWSTRRYRNAMAEVNAAMAAGRFGLAVRNLEQILAWRIDSNEAAYVLGVCEQSRGRNQAADAAWARVMPGSDFTQRATLARLRLYHDTGRLAEAEQLILDAVSDPRNDATDLRVCSCRFTARSAARTKRRSWSKSGGNT